MITAKQIEELIESTKYPYEQTKWLESMGFKSFIREFRTVGIKIPRMSGKTTAISEFVSNKSALYITGSSPDSILSKNIMGMRTTQPLPGLKFQYVVIDECRKISDEEIYNFLYDLKYHLNLLTEDFRVIIIGT